MSETLTLSAALEASGKGQALYNDGERRAFVSERDDHFDLGVKDLAGKETRLNQTDAALRTILSLHGVPVDAGWKPL
jgi:hypothetical protein